MKLRDFLEELMENPEGYVCKQYRRFGLTILKRVRVDNEIGKQIVGHWLFCCKKAIDCIPEEYLNEELEDEISFNPVDNSLMVTILQ